MAFRKKAERLLAHNPDIMVVSECECLEKTKNIPIAGCKVWVGENKNKGLMIASCSPEISFQISNFYNEEFKYIVPLDVTRGGLKFLMLAVWTKSTESIFSSYIVQLNRAIKFYSGFLNDRTIIAGDFNSSAIWDNGDKKEANHSDTTRMLEEYNIRSVYHLYYKEEQGKESSPTLYMYRKRDKGYHIDYVFCGQLWTKKLQHVSIGKYEEWADCSDHVPIVVDFGTQK